MKWKQVWKNKIARFFAVLSLCLAACILGETLPLLWGNGLQTAFAEAESISELSDGVMKLRAENLEAVLQYGVQGVARYGRKCLVRGSITSKQGSFKGSIEFVLKDTEGRQQCYEYSVAAGAGSSSDFSAVLPMHCYFVSVEARLKDADGKVLTEREIPLKRLNIGTGSVIGVFGNGQKSEYHYFSSFGCNVFYLSPEDIAEQPEGLDFFDILVFDGYQRGSLSDAKLMAVKEWVAAGGTLSIGTGAAGEETLFALEEAGLYHGKIIGTADMQTCYGLNSAMQKKLNSAIFSYEVQRNNLYEFLTDYGNQKEALLETEWGRNYIGDSMENFYKQEELSILYVTETAKLCSFLPEKGISAITENGETILFTERYGNGCLQWFAASLARKQSDYYGVYFVFLMQQNQSPVGAERLLNLTSYSSSYLKYKVFEGLEEYKTSGILKYIFLLFVYVLVAGPGIYFLLKKTGKSSWSFVLTPVTAVLFLLLIYAAGSDTRITKPYVKYVEKIESDGEKTSAGLTVTLAAPTGRDWGIRLAGKPTVRLYQSSVSSFYDINNFYQIEYYYNYIDSRNSHAIVGGAVQEEEETVLTFSKVLPFTEIEAEVEYQVAVPELVKEEIQLSELGVDGSLTNVSDNVFEEAYLYCEGVLVSVGAIKPEETVKLREREQTVLLNQQAANELYTQIMDNDETTESTLAKAYLYQEFSNKSSGSWFVGVTKQASEENPLLQESKEYTIAGGVTMYCLKLPTETLEESFRLLTDETMQVLEGEYTVKDPYRYMASDVLEVEYMLPKGNITEIVFPTFYNQIYHSYQMQGWDGTISLYNYELKSYEQFVSEFREQSITEVAPYLSEDRVIRVRFEKNPLYEGYSMQLPYLAYYLRREDEELD